MKHLKVLSHNSLFFLLCAAFFLIGPSFVSAETIQSFSTDIKLNQDGSFVVEETIVYDFGNEERHGIFSFY